MTTTITRATRDLQAELRERAEKKKMALVRAAKDRKRAAKEKAPPPSARVSVLAKLNEILVLLKQPTQSGPVKFIITERDINGKIKSFEVKG